MTRLVFHLVPHTHWDREWYRVEAALRVGLVGMLDDLMGRLARDASLSHFLFDGQTILLEDYLRVRPTQAAALAGFIRSGRLEVGPWYVLADEQLVSGESLVRNLLVGGRMADRLGRRSGVLYCPDAFGHPGMLPDLAREFGLKHAILWRGVADTAPAVDGFRWTGPAHGRVFVYHLPPQGYEVGADLPVDRAALAEVWPRLRQQLLARSLGPHVPVFIGADHHWVHRDLALLRTLIAELEPGNEVRISRADAAVAALAGAAHDVPERSGELRDTSPATWVLQGTHSTRAPLKRRNSEIELALERLAAPLVALAGGNDLRASLAFAWTTLLANHFHDSICGTVSDDVARTMETRFAAVEAAGMEVTRRALHRIIGHDPDRAREDPAKVEPRLVLWNPAPRPRGGVVLARISAFRGDVIVGPPGGRLPRIGSADLPHSLSSGDEEFPLQVIHRERTTERLHADHHYPDLDEVEMAIVALDAPPVPGMSWVSLRGARDSERRGNPVTSAPESLDNGLIHLSLSRRGRLDLHDLVRDQKFPDLLEILGVEDRGDTYTFCPLGKERVLETIGDVERRIIASGPLCGALEASWTVRTGSGTVDLRLVAMLLADSPLVRCKLDVHNHAVNHRLRICLPLGLDGEQLVTGAQMGSVHRASVDLEGQGSPLEAAVSTVPAHRYAAAQRDRRGLAFLAPGFFEAEWLDGDLTVTLLRAIGELSRNDLDTRAGHAAWPVPTPIAQCPGRSRIAFALAPIDATTNVPELWEDAFVPLQAIWLRDATGLAEPLDSIELEGDGIVLSTIKPAEESDGVVIRCFNATDREVHGLLKFGAPRLRAMRIRADEREPVTASLGNGGRTLAFTAMPYSWVTFMVYQ